MASASPPRGHVFRVHHPLVSVNEPAALAPRWATVCSLITTAKLNDVEPFGYLRDVLQRLSDGHPMSRLDDLLPWNWASSVAVAA
jgi:hypothetical protein